MPVALRTLANRLSSAELNACDLVPGEGLPCDESTVAAWLVHFKTPRGPLFALFRFDTDVIALFDICRPLGLIRMGDEADAYWQTVCALSADGAAGDLVRPRPAAPDTAAIVGQESPVAEEPPVRLSMVPPVYPDEARSQGVDGVVVVMVLVGRDGSVKESMALTGPRPLLDAALVASRQMRFAPARTGGEALEAWVQVPFVFRLR